MLSFLAKNDYRNNIAHFPFVFFLNAWSLFSPSLHLLCLVLWVCVFWHGFVIFKIVSDLSPNLFCGCCNCPFGTMSLACSPSPSFPLAAILFHLSPFLAPSFLLSLCNSLTNPRHVQHTCSSQNCLLFRWFVFFINNNVAFPIPFCQEMETIALWHFFFFFGILHLCSGWQRIFVSHNAGPSISNLLCVEAFPCRPPAFHPASSTCPFSS